MRSATLCLSLILGCGVITIACRDGGDGPPDVRSDPDSSALDEFTRRVEEYAAMRRRLAGPFGAIDETKSPQEIANREAALAGAVQNTRSDAKRGDIFTPQAAPIIKARIKEIYKSSPQVRDTHRDAEVEVPDFIPQVNMVYPTTFPLGTFPPTVLNILPRLPKELEYRIVTDHLILRDVEANVIVDVLPDAIP